MMKPVSFFWYLYGAVALALVLTITALFFTINYVEGQNDWQDFARDIQQTLLIAQVECQSQNLNNECVKDAVFDQGFEMTTAFYDQGSEVIDEWQHINTHITVYTYQSGFQAQLASQPGFWLRDNQDHLDNAAEDDDVFAMLFTAGIVTVLLLISIALFLYWPVKRLIHWLQKLEAASEAIGNEDYSSTLPTLNVRPFNQLSYRFNRMTSLIRNNLEEKRLLANAMAHEMRTPLSRARLALGLLQRQPGEEMQTELMSDLDRYLDELEKVTDNSLQLVRLQNSEAELIHLPLNVWLETKLLSVQSKASKITWHTEFEACQIKTDERFLNLIIDNLFSNAERYAETSIQVTLKQQGKHCVLIIADDGPGIPQELREKALQPFSRLDESRDRRSGGIGLGLALVNTACQRLNIGLAMRNSHPGLCVTLTF